MTEEQRALIAKIEAATEPSRELDEAVYVSPGYWWDSGESEWCAPDSPRSEPGGVPTFTAHSEIAATIISDMEDMCWSVRKVCDEPAEAWCWNQYQAPNTALKATARTTAIALCIAALKVRFA